MADIARILSIDRRKVQVGLDRLNEAVPRQILCHSGEIRNERKNKHSLNASSIASRGRVMTRKLPFLDLC